MNEPIYKERLRLYRQAAGLVLLGTAIAVLLCIRFTSRTEKDLERTRAQVLLQTIYRLEEAHYMEYGSYLPINHEMNSQVLKLDHLRGSLQFNVVAAESSFAAFVDARPGPGSPVETWRVDSANPDPVLVTKNR